MARPSNTATAAQSSPASTATPAPTVAPVVTTDGTPLPQGGMPGWSITLPDGTILLVIMDMDAQGNVGALYGMIPTLPYVVTGQPFNQ